LNRKEKATATSIVVCQFVKKERRRETQEQMIKGGPRVTGGGPSIIGKVAVINEGTKRPRKRSAKLKKVEETWSTRKDQPADKGASAMKTDPRSKPRKTERLKVGD